MKVANDQRLAGGQSRSEVGVVFEVVGHLTAEPVMDPQGGLVDFLVVSQVADCALGLGLGFTIAEHLHPPQIVLVQR